jgi:hypothetical protein
VLDRLGHELVVEQVDHLALASGRDVHLHVQPNVLRLRGPRSGAATCAPTLRPRPPTWLSEFALTPYRRHRAGLSSIPDAIDGFPRQSRMHARPEGMCRARRCPVAAMDHGGPHRPAAQTW